MKVRTLGNLVAALSLAAFAPIAACAERGAGGTGTTTASPR